MFSRASDAHPDDPKFIRLQTDQLSGPSKLQSPIQALHPKNSPAVFNSRPLLIYIPFHVSEPPSHIAELCNCTLGVKPWRHRATLPFDILLSISGRLSNGNEQRLKTMLEDATAYINPRPRVFVEFSPLQSDRYIQDIAEEQKDDDWVSGPNTAFYDALLDGRIYQQYTKHYAFVQQMETDVCALKTGWLDELVAPMLDPSKHVLVSGASIKGDCLYYKGFDYCNPVKNIDSHMLKHVNGNALYRMGNELANVLLQARSMFQNSEPFDLAIYWAMTSMGLKVT